VLYPPKMPAARRLCRYIEEFDTVELNASFYRWPKDSTFLKWRTELPEGFAMSVKAHRGLTHYRRLNAPQPWIERFERCWQLLDGRRGAVLVILLGGGDKGTQDRDIRAAKELARQLGMEDGHGD